MFRATQGTLANIPGIQRALTAFAGGGQASATALPHSVNEITTCATGGDSVVLPAAKQGISVFVQNKGAASCNVFPAVGDSINSGAANAAFAVANGKSAFFIALADGIWASMLSA